VGTGSLLKVLNKTKEKMGDEISIQKGAWANVKQYFRDVRVEMKKVTWPGKQEIYGTTVMVILTTFLFGIYFAICDKAFAALVSRVLRFFQHHT
jgi:preprotein translocase subunit SecE